MSHLEEVMNGLAQDQNVPELVWGKVEEALQNLPDNKVHVPKKRWQWRGKVAAAAAVLAVGGSTFCYCNPALAAKIPLLGHIFANVEESVPFSGDYSEKAELLFGSENGGEERYTATNAGVTIAASEVYCDGVSVFLTAQIEAEQGGFEEMPSHSLNGSDGTSYGMYLRGTWRLQGEEKAHELIADAIEGSVVDDHTFAGMLKLDLLDYQQEQGVVELQFGSVGWDGEASDREEISEEVRVDGAWKISVPFSVDHASVKEIAIQEEKNGYTIQKIKVSPYQVVAYVDAPVSAVEKDFSRADYEAKLGLKEGEEDPAISYEEFLAELSKPSMQPCETVICNQDGEVLAFGDSSTTSGITTFAVDGKKLETLSIYVFVDAENYLDANGRIDREAAMEQAVVTAEVPL